MTLAKCRECSRYEVCGKEGRMVQIDDHTWNEYNQLDNVEEFCQHYEPAGTSSKAEIIDEFARRVKESASHGWIKSIDKIAEEMKGEMDLSGQFEWSDVNKNPPETCGMPVLIVVINQYGQRRVIKGFTNYSCPLEFKTNDKEYANLGTYWKVTHWAPMPELPKIEKEE